MYYLFLLAFVFFSGFVGFRPKCTKLVLFFLHKKEGILFLFWFFNGKKSGWRREKEKINASLFFGIFFFLLILLLFFVCLLFLFTITNKHNMCEVVLATNIAKSVFWGGYFSVWIFRLDGWYIETKGTIKKQHK